MTPKGQERSYTEVQPAVLHDANGIEIRKGYRPPFIKGGFDPRRYVPPKGVKPKRLVGAITLLAATRKAFRKHTAASFAATSTVEGMRHAKMAKLFFDIERELLGHKPSRANSTKNHSLRLSDTVAKVAPISTAKPMANPGQNPAPIPPVAEVQKPANSPEIDDCPF